MFLNEFVTGPGQLRFDGPGPGPTSHFESAKSGYDD
jgi:hypothetical protein